MRILISLYVDASLWCDEENKNKEPYSKRWRRTIYKADRWETETPQDVNHHPTCELLPWEHITYLDEHEPP
jgi:hypothetical protein